MAAALDYTGCRHVLATLRPVDPVVAADATMAAYPAMIVGGSFEPDRSAAAFHQAVKAMHDAGRPLDNWLPFTHTGP